MAKSTTKHHESKPQSDDRFKMDESFEAGPSSRSARSHSSVHTTNASDDEEDADNQVSDDNEEHGDVPEEEVEDDAATDGDAEDPMNADGPAALTVKPLSPEELAKFNEAQQRAGVIYISRIPPGMRPTKIRHLMSTYGEVGRVYLQQEDAKRAYLRKKFTSTKKAHYVEGWVEFKDKRVARQTADMLNAQPIGGKKGTRWRDDIWSMKYLPKFKWYMLTEQLAHERAMRTAKLRMELEESRKEQKDYLHNVELARVLEKRKARKRKAAQAKGLPVDEDGLLPPPKKRRTDGEKDKKKDRKPPLSEPSKAKDTSKLKGVLASIF